MAFGFQPGSFRNGRKEQIMRKETTRWKLLGAAGALALGFGMSTAQAATLVQGNSAPKLTDSAIHVAEVGGSAGAGAGADASAGDSGASAGVDIGADASADPGGDSSAGDTSSGGRTSSSGGP